MNSQQSAAASRANGRLCGAEQQMTEPEGWILCLRCGNQRQWYSMLCLGLPSNFPKDAEKIERRTGRAYKTHSQSGENAFL